MIIGGPGGTLQGGQGWRRYQSRLQRDRKRRGFLIKCGKISVALFAAGMLVYGFTTRSLGNAEQTPAPEAAKSEGASPLVAVQRSAPRPISPVRNKEELRRLFGSRDLGSLTQGELRVPVSGQYVNVKTTLDMPLQEYLTQKLDRQNSRYIGIVVLDPDTGRVLSLAGHDRAFPDRNPCLTGMFPAASIFKIVTAAAAIQRKGLTPDTPLTYRGRKHTLYKTQVSTPNEPNANVISLKDSFAQSVNPVFGKLGALYLGRDALLSEARDFGFERDIRFDLEVVPSTLMASDDPYQLAELASGFNRTTLISPLHGALMAAAIASEGQMPEPFMIESVTDANGRPIYQGRPGTPTRSIAPETARRLRVLMAETINSGTCRKSFQGYQKDPVLSHLDMGGKTGSINSRAQEGRRFDLFVGYAMDRVSGRKIAMSVIVAHEKLIGIRARHYARMIIDACFGATGPAVDTPDDEPPEAELPETSAS